VIRFDYGAIVPWVRRTERGIRAIAGPDTLLLRTGVPLRGENHTIVGEFTVTQGERVTFDLTWCSTFDVQPEEMDAIGAVESTEQWWRDWATRCRYDGSWREAVIRSLITLKALTYAPTGGIVAAPTTSLPERLGGVRNWDCRFCWIRDATFALYALMLGGYVDEARA
jgi:GH15 family glucan-1,4-alpha-glucosidase